MAGLFHRHRHTQVIHVQHGERLDGSHATQILRRCQCGGYDVETLEGLWPAGLFTPATTTGGN
jgi:hypothetical protein